MLNHSTSLPRLVDVIGDSNFGASLLSVLHDLCGADHCVIFLLSGSGPREIVSSSFDGTDTAHQRASKYVAMDFWKRDPTMSEAWRNSNDLAPRLIKLNINGLADRDLRTHIYPHVSERLLLCGQSTAGSIALSIVRTDTGASTSLSREVETDIQHFAPALLSILGKHATLVMQKAKLCDALTSLAEIENVIALSMEHLPRREMQVCARILYGIHTTGIALELGISEQTVTTYRKRLYSRLAIGTQRELVIWYIRRWSEFINSLDVRRQSLPH